MSVIISLLIFGFSVYLFMVTLNRIKKLEDGVIDAQLKKEMEGLIVEFNAAATRNIEMLEQKIEEIQRLIQRANQKIFQLDERIERAQRPVVVEKIVEKPVVSETLSKPEKQRKAVSRERTEFSSSDKVFSQKQEHELPLSRDEQLKQYLLAGKSREELLEMGFVENEINLISFLLKTEKK
ncbi:hypothetical protein [Thermospira aquatica]|uniref:Uncharacterized protein n=1 Tax=Thermospira aquatica TaxID=2828656 RepID=A0AAX3BF37_9SPIR|nr:hypothetical protein [Thermospira aquatica]URA10949.1 hypothetical protein KDW03_03860 [Thermospira aquatica]